jgi:hypothetical protein
VSAYENDPRVTAWPDGTFGVSDGQTPRHVCPGLFGGYVAHSMGADDVDGLGFDTADEAIRSLIGEPQ